MNNSNINYKPLMEEALRKLEKMQSKLSILENSKTEPIAIIGMGCRFPKEANNPEKFWQQLSNGVDAITEVPPDRWDINAYYDPNPETLGKMSTRYGGFLKQVDIFDAKFFHISPKEAISLDPQQRLLLEVSWEALENANQVPEQLFNSLTGVFVGISTSDYTKVLWQSGSITEIDAYFGTGNSLSVAAGRLSYYLGLTGPSLAVDTACSSSLVTVHLACQSLRQGECNLALASGVNLILSPEPTINFSKAKMMAADGRCKTFDAAADGYVRGEGCGVIVLKRLSDAIADGNNILALIRGSAVNQDGRSSGLTVPNGPSQEAVIRQALACAGVLAPQIDYIEAHGTGTSLGDPIEVEALAGVFTSSRLKDKPLIIGSVKTNIGHLEAAAGIAGLIKVVLSLQHQEIPPHLNFQKPSPYINWSNLPIIIPTSKTPWLASERRRLAGVSSFGFCGTNAHVIIEEAPLENQKLKVKSQNQEVDRPLHLLTLAAKTEAALYNLAHKYSEYLDKNSTLALEDICFTANTGRSHFQHRLSVVASSNSEVCEKLAAFNMGKEAVGLFHAKHTSQSINQPKIAFLFTGQGSQYIGMGRQLYETQPYFRQILNQCDEILRPYLGESLLPILYENLGTNSKIDETIYTQPALFVIEYAIAELWRRWGIEPSVVIGHSLGEYVAACIAGVFSLEEGLKLVAQRSCLVQSLPHNGGMLAVFADEDQVAATIRPYNKEVSIAAINGTKNIVISGHRQALEEVKDFFVSQRIETRQLKVSHAFHSPLVEPILHKFEEIASKINFKAPTIPLISNLSGGIMASGHNNIDATYWRRHLREPVKFTAMIKTLFEQGYDKFLEIGSKPILSGLGKRFQQEGISTELEHHITATWLPSLAQGQDDWQVLLNSLSTLYVQGVNINWKGLDQDYSRNYLSLPTYPFQQKRYWFEGKYNMSQDNLILNNSHTNNSQVNNTDEIELLAKQLPITTPERNRRDSIVSKLCNLTGRLLQINASEVEIDAPFLEMGADSITLIDAIQNIESIYGVKIAISQLFEELRTINALACYIDQNLPSEIVSVNSLQVKSENFLTNTNALVQSTETESENFIQSVISQQLQVMSQQLERLGNSNFTNYQTPTSPITKVILSDVEQAKSSTSTSLAIKDQNIITSPFQYKETKETQSINLNLKQQQHLEALIARYTQRTRKSKELAQFYRSNLADSRSVAGLRPSIKEMLYPIVGDKAQGAYFWDVDGNKYVDITMGFGVLLFGHAPIFITEALQEQISKGIQIGPQSNLAGKVAHLICEITGMERVAFCNSGTEGVMTALRLARTASRRNKIALFTNSYHGHYDGVLAAINSKLNTIPLVPGVTPLTVQDVIVLDYSNPESLNILQANAHELAAVLVEPVQSRYPEFQPKEFLQKLRQLTHIAGIALIFDEVLTGFRIHPGGAQAWFEIEADIAIYGKIVGGGMPIGIVAGKGIYMNGIDGGLWNYGDASYPQAEKTFFAGTFNKNHMAMAAAKSVLEHLKKQGNTLQQHLNQRTSRLADTLNNYFKDENLPIRIVSFGSLFRFSFFSNLDLLFYHLLEKGIYIWEGRSCFLSTEHSDEDIDYIIQSVKNSIKEMQAGGFLHE